ncbi:MAG: ATP-binding protein [Planctomycetes bacterium]|nr:ATP-binding protein [Planctomycetota bacterium]
MKEFTVISGKGGTGKTSIVACFAALSNDAVFADCDVDASNLPLLLEPTLCLRREFYSGRTARIDADRCIDCFECANHCRFDAIVIGNEDSIPQSCTVDQVACEGCGVCALVCPVEAIEFSEKLSGEWFVSETRHGPMVHARLGIAADNSGKLVSDIREMARKLATEKSRNLIIIDGSPGIGCPVIASVTGADLILAVTETTLSGLHDLKRVAGLAGHFDLPMVVILNKCDLNDDVAKEIEKFCHQKNLSIVGRIPYCTDFTEAMLVKKSLVEYGDGAVAEAVKTAWEKIRHLLEER